MKGLNIADMRRHPSLIPLFFCVGLGAVGAFGYTVRLAMFNPDVSWNKRTNPEPNQAYANKQYKFFSPTLDYSKHTTGAPVIKED